MQRVIAINLNGNAYQLDEHGYEALRAYLDRAEHVLTDNPDRAEILADLEQAIADKCQKYLGHHKTVVTVGEIDQIIAEMGPVDTAPGERENHPSDQASDGATAEPRHPGAPRRLYRIPDGAVIAGVCNGLASYFQVDAAIVRIVFVVAALLTKGVGILVYVGMMFLIPEADTPEARAAAAGAPLNAKDVLDRAKQQYAEGRKQWRRHWRQQSRQWRQHGWPSGKPFAYGPPPPGAAVVLPVFGLVHVALFLVMAAMVVSLVNTGAILNWELPADVPVWAGVLILLIAYQVAVSPLRAARHWASVSGPGGAPAWLAFWNAVMWLVAMAFVVWIASNNIPEIGEFLRHVPELLQDFAYAIRDLVAR